MSILKDIISGNGQEEILRDYIDRLYSNGACDSTVLEVFSLVKSYNPQLFSKYEKDILSYMGLYYKNLSPDNLKQHIFLSLGSAIESEYGRCYTPVQASLVNSIHNNKIFSFSAPTSTGKSFVFMNFIKDAENDVAVIVPSRALINEYLIKIREEITDKAVLVLPFVDRINTNNAHKFVFVLTPERARVLFERKQEFKLDYILFDEAQLGDEKSPRGVYFDSIIRRCAKHFLDTKFVFAHPFVSNPEAQLSKNSLDSNESMSIPYKYKNVGQTYIRRKESDNTFAHFMLDSSIAKNCETCEKDPIEEVLKRKGSILVYASKNRILNGEIFKSFDKYIKLCPVIQNEQLDEIIEELKEYLGCSTDNRSHYYSPLVANLKHGILIHHGSLPLYVRQIIEKVAKMNLCQICFATSTLEQGINMPFDLVYIDRLESSDPLAVKNLIGRAGRSTTNPTFDYGTVVLGRYTQMTKFRKLMNDEAKLIEQSQLDYYDEEDKDDLNDFKKAINGDNYIDKYNMTSAQLNNLIGNNDVDASIKFILDNLNFVKVNLLTKELVYDGLIPNFIKIYEHYLGRNFVTQEVRVLGTALKIMLYKVKNYSFKGICQIRYDEACDRKNNRKRQLYNPSLKPGYMIGYADIPNKNLNPYFKYHPDKSTNNVIYDDVVYDTYDFIDKLIDFKLSDIYYAAFDKYFEKTGDERARNVCKFVKYSTIDDRKIMMLRYGMTFEDIEHIGDYISEIDESHIVVKDEFNSLPDNYKKCLEQFI